jgi:archaellum component FlaC
MKNLLLFWALALCLNSYGQSKKQQIVALNYSIDSLNVILSITRNKAAKDIGGLNTTIENLSKEISDLKRDLFKLESSVSTLEKDKSKLALENEKFKTDLEEISKINVELEAKVKILNNEIASKERDIAELKNSTFTEKAEITTAEHPNDKVIYASGGETSVNWNKIMSEYEGPDYDGHDFWGECITSPHYARASSALSSQGIQSYGANNIKDYDPRTAWVEGKSDYGIGEYFSVHGNAFWMAEIYIFNGYQRSYSSWKNNSRVKRFRVYVDNRPICYLELKDKMGGQHFNFDDYNLYDNFGANGNWENLKFKFEIVEVYKGDKWKDVAISEIHAKGCCFNSNTNILNFNEPLLIGNLDNGQEISSLDIETGEIVVTKVVRSAEQIHHILLKISTEDYTVELTPSHPLFIKGHGLKSLAALKRDYNLVNYDEMLGKIEILVWNNQKQTSEYQKLTKVDKITGDFETHTILKLEKGRTYIANGFVTSVY